VSASTAPRSSRAIAYTAGAAGLLGASMAGALMAGLDALVRVRPRGIAASARLLELAPSPEDGCEIQVTLTGPGADQPGFAGLFAGRGRLLAGPATRVATGWRRHARALPGSPAPVLGVGDEVRVTADPFADCDDPFALGARTSQLMTRLGPLKVTEARPADGSSRAIVYLHGRNGHRQTGGWLAPSALQADWRIVLPSYRNDEDSAHTGRYLLGGEWEDLAHVLAALGRDGVDQVVLVGWSMGGNIAASYLRHRHRSPQLFAGHPRPVGLVLDAAALDWGPVLRHAAHQRRLPGRMAPAVMTYGQVVRRIDWRALNHLSDQGHLDLPVLAFHGEQDDTVPVEVSEALATALPHVHYEPFAGAGHCRSVNVDPRRYLETFQAFLVEL
jgi:pimeloyl-ACP methyl ester carboxylesterase